MEWDYLARTRGPLRNVGIIGGSVSGFATYTGILAGENIAGLSPATISNSYATGNVNIMGAESAGQAAGGLVGINFLSTISNCYATGSVTGTDEGN